ncbi:uncharacterized protein LOC132737851 isoform X2 [Ruditapes philippinarum]|uniref:uncharacterized protein LOC132737851 isoform X2 n=1 Tax=Ruditapes philippinarum TaxID=129788 RepID=UPI00295A9AB0|nr:uncharacterized protein LOC132737851 isoform X2 [Ruditapes philippinarum]
MKGGILFFVVAALALFNGRPANAIPVITTLTKAVEVVSFGIDVYSFFSSILGGEDEVQSTPAPFEYDRIINRISERIESSTEAIIFKIELQAYLSELREVALTVKQLLIDMEYIIKAKSKEIREEQQKRFLKSYELHKIKIYKIKSLLTFRVPVSGISNTLLSLITNEFECGMTRLEEFQNYYMTLVSDVVALDLLNERLAEKSLYNETLATWENAITSLFEDFEKQKDTCKAKFFELVKKDFEKTTDPLQMYENSKTKYPNKTIDVLFLKGTYCIWYRKKYDNILKKKQDKAMTFAVINSEDNLVASRNKAQYLKVTLKAKFDNCLGDTDTILSYLDALGDDLILWLMFPQDRAAEFKILLHENSTAIKINSAIDGTNYITVFYVRPLDEDAHSKLSSADFDTVFYEDLHAEEGSDGDKKRLLSYKSIIIIIFSICSALAIIFNIVIFTRCRCVRRHY